jgi:predicted SnoaL-like aldol condensation-catalyzing enzyme
MTAEVSRRLREFYRDLLGQGDLARLERFVAPSYLSHVPVFAGAGPAPGIDALRARLASFGSVPHRLARVVVDGDLAFAHVLYEGTERVSGVDVFRLDSQTRILEHWNVRQPLADGRAGWAERFGDGMPATADFPFAREWVRARIETMLAEVWGRGRSELVPDFYAESYIQHNPDMPGGFERIRQVVQHDIARYLERSGGPFPITVHHLGAEGDLACVHLSIFMAGLNRDDGARSTNVDIFRLDRHGRMIEHWDVLQIEGIALPASARIF